VTEQPSNIYTNSIPKLTDLVRWLTPCCKVVRLLLLHSRKDARTRLDASGTVPLFCAIEAGNLNVCRELLSVDPEEQV
jgi:hypothetical protein